MNRTIKMLVEKEIERHALVIYDDQEIIDRK